LIANIKQRLIFLFFVVIAGHVLSYILAPSISPENIGAPWYWAVAWYQYIPFFVLGIIVYQLKLMCAIRGTDFKIKMISISLVASVALSIFMFLFFDWPFDVSDKIVPKKFINLLIASTPMLFFLMLFATIKTPRFIVNHITVFLGKISYSVYLIHPLIVYLLIPSYRNIQNSLGNSLASFATCIVLTFVILIPISYVSFIMIENPAIRFGKHLTSRKA
jgi:peptidoglycan/LPS O-acetylase OafA/YrhL